MDGVVCSAAEAAMLREQCGHNFLLVTPGIRLPGDAPGRSATRRHASRCACRWREPSSHGAFDYRSG